jgi:hypothetical protein
MYNAASTLVTGETTMPKLNVAKIKSVIPYIKSVCRDHCPEGAVPYPIVADHEKLVLTPLSSFREMWERIEQPVFIGVAMLAKETLDLIMVMFPAQVSTELRKELTETVTRSLANRIAVDALPIGAH